MNTKERYELYRSLREQGKTYQEIADLVGVNRRSVQNYCKLHKELQYTEEERKQASVNRASKNLKQHQYESRSNEYWIDKVRKKYDLLYELVSVGEPYGKRKDRVITIRCTGCGTEKEISSVSLRGKNCDRETRCFVCHPKMEIPKPKMTQSEIAIRAMNNRIERLRHKTEKEKRKASRRLERDQIAINFCKCGNVILSNHRTCNECKRKQARKAEERKETIRRLRVLDDFDPEVTLEWTINRFNNICYLCGKPCDRKDFHYRNGVFIVGNNYPTMEHFIPICKGGKHTKENVKLAHHGCNSKKGRKLIVA